MHSIVIYLLVILVYKYICKLRLCITVEREGDKRRPAHCLVASPAAKPSVRTNVNVLQCGIIIRASGCNTGF